MSPAIAPDMGKSRIWRYLLPSCLLGTACGGDAVDLGHGEELGWADVSVSDADEAGVANAEPRTLYQDENRVVGFTVDETILYALLTYPNAYELVSCPIEKCRSERTTLYRGSRASDSSPFFTQLHLVDDWVVWNQPNEGISSCPVTGCQELTTVATWADDMASDGENAYWVDDNTRGLLRWAPGRDARRLRDLDIAQPSRIVAHDGFVYILSGSSVYRARNDGSSEAELVVADEHISDVLVDGSDLFFSVDILTGSISQCAAEDCRERRSLATNQRWPRRLRISDDELFWLNEAPATSPTEQVVLMSCKLPACASTQQRGELITRDWDGFAKVPPYAVNRQYVVWLEAFRGFGSVLRLVTR